jgi:hypothetical protein
MKSKRAGRRATDSSASGRNLPDEARVQGALQSALQWNAGGWNAPKIPSVLRYCHLCARNNLLPICPEQTQCPS